ncbi:heme ABC transporter ATP-binding protein [Methanocella arvoryzae]|uniref:Cobalamin import ATP-binding protein BtuD n=1 Tax=Methanocella arvoryzae (strain DSM 22066 / NBRC 105507 / MRE50) TaxID=351160 RepID=Q0W0R0_METAR|nr:heme ABC transporter ATP-binding protein [Methanocella arvoryzae]CAJ38033.1 ABC-type transport system, ATPase component [Methanocella arvoryzae MRE50]
MLDVTDLSCKYGNARILENIFFTTRKGECIGIIGPNGSGKSTLLKTLSKVMKPASGSIVVCGKELKDISMNELARSMAVVPQDTNVDFNFSCLDIVLMGRHPHLGRFAVEGKKDYDIARQSMELTNTWHLKDRNISELSGGERQRVIIARALTQEPSVLLLDEPVSHLDINHQIEIMELIQHLKNDRGLLVIVVIHDLNLAARYCDRLILLNENTIQAAGTPSEVLTREHIRRAFRADVLVRRHPMTGTIYITLLNSITTTEPESDGKTIHLVCGAGTGTQLMYQLKTAGYNLTAGVLNVLDTDHETALHLNVNTIVDAPFSPITPESYAANVDALKAADYVVLSDVPFGWGNIKNLEAVLEVSGAKPVILIAGWQNRDFTGGKAGELIQAILNKGAVEVTSADEVVRKLAEI